MAKARRTTHRSTAGKKLYAVRDANGPLQGHPDLRARAPRRPRRTSRRPSSRRAGKKKAAKKKTRQEEDRQEALGAVAGPGRRRVGRPGLRSPCVRPAQPEGAVSCAPACRSSPPPSRAAAPLASPQPLDGCRGSTSTSTRRSTSRPSRPTGGRTAPLAPDPQRPHAGIVWYVERDAREEGASKDGRRARRPPRALLRQGLEEPQGDRPPRASRTCPAGQRQPDLGVDFQQVAEGTLILELQRGSDEKTRLARRAPVHGVRPGALDAEAERAVRLLIAKYPPPPRAATP